MIEAVVAGVIVMLVGIAISTIFVSTMRTQTTATLSERRLAAAEGLFERLKADNRWAGASGAGCNSMPVGATQQPCSAAWLRSTYASDGLVDQTSTERKIRYDTSFSVVGVDDELDETGKDDVDGMRPDYYAATIYVWRDGLTYAQAKERREVAELSGTIDPPGRVSTGAISIDVCKVKRQWDERIPIASCPEQHEVLLGYPAGVIGGGGDPHGTYDWDVALDRAGPGGGAIGWAMVTYEVEPANAVTMELRRKDGQSVYPTGVSPPPAAGCTSPTDTVVRCSMSPGQPTRRVAGLKPGQYIVEMTNYPNGYEPWPLHSVPSGDTAIVEAGRASRVLQVIKPERRDQYTVSLRSCDHSEVRTWGTGPCVNNIQPSGLSGFLAPAASARAHWSFDSSKGIFSSGIEEVPKGATQITFNQLAPGLYTPRIVTGGQRSLRLTHGVGGGLDYMWLNSKQDGIPGGDFPNSGDAYYTRHWCDYARRVAFLGGVGLGPSGGNVPHEHFVYDSVTNADGTTSWVVVDSYIHQHYYYPATDCLSASGGGGPPGPGGGGA